MNSGPLKVSLLFHRVHGKRKIQRCPCNHWQWRRDRYWNERLQMSWRYEKYRAPVKHTNMIGNISGKFIVSFPQLHLVPSIHSLFGTRNWNSSPPQGFSYSSCTTVSFLESRYDLSVDISILRIAILISGTSCSTTHPQQWALSPKLREAYGWLISRTEQHTD